VTGDTGNLAHCRQDAAVPAGSTIVREVAVRRCDLANWAVEELLPLVVKVGPLHWRWSWRGRGSAEAVVCLR
jgi:hypothetical protein